MKRVLVLAPLGRDAAVVADLLSSDYAVEVIVKPTDLAGEIRKGAALAIVTEEALSAPVVTELKTLFAEQEAWSDFPMIIFNAPSSFRIGRSLETWKPLGNVTVLDRPVRGSILRSAVAAAYRSRQRQYQARQAIENRDQFLAMLSHELRNPLAAIALTTQTMLRQEKPESAKKLQVIHDQAQLLSRLVDDLLDVARVTSGKVALQRTTLNLVELIDRSVGAMRGLVEANGITLYWHAPDRPVFASADAARIDQVVTNLINNASKYTQAGGRIDVSVEGEGENVSIRVRDTGIGIDPAMLNRIFDLFSQVDNALDRARGGLGIGLTVVKHLVELHGGTVRASSRGPGSGSEFVVTLPIVHAAPHVAAAGAPSYAESGNKNIVVVEDNKDIRESLEELLVDLGHVVKTAPDGQAGADLIVSTQPDLALVDIGLPKLNGYQVAEKVRALVGDRVYLIALTGYGQPEDKRRALAAGFHTHLTKPIYVADIERTIRQHPRA